MVLLVFQQQVMCQMEEHGIPYLLSVTNIYFSMEALTIKEKH